MRATFISMVSVLLAAIAVCLFSMLYQFSVMDGIAVMCDSAIECVRSDDIPGAQKYVDEIRTVFDKSSTVLEMVASHEDLHDTLGCITDARTALECEDVDDAYQALVKLQGMIDHMRDHERLSIANLC